MKNESAPCCGPRCGALRLLIQEARAQACFDDVQAVPVVFVLVVLAVDPLIGGAVEAGVVTLQDLCIWLVSSWKERVSMEQLPGELVAAYAALFVGCPHAYAVQQRDGSYWRVAEPLSLPLLTAHLTGRWTLGTYLLDQESQCSFAVLDADSADGLARLAGLSDELRQSGIPSLLEASRRGGHLWLHFLGATPAGRVRAWLLPYVEALGAELYPKQDVLAPGGSGSLIRCPWEDISAAGAGIPFSRVMPGGAGCRSGKRSRPVVPGPSSTSSGLPFRRWHR